MANGYAKYSGIGGGTGGGGGGVTSLDSITGAINLIAGTGISITDNSPSAGDITIAATGAGSGTVTSVSVVSANGLAGTVANPTTTPAITLSTTITGVLKGNGTAISAAVAGTDYVIPSGSITGTAGNITATSNSTLTTLSALSLPGAQVTGNIAGNAANITATSNSTLTTLSALSLPGAQVTGNIAGNAGNVTGIVAVVNGGTSLAALTLNNVILGNGTSAPQFVAPSLAGNVLMSDGTTWSSEPLAAASAFAAYHSSLINTSSGVVSGAPFQTFDNSPAFTFTPAISGTYKIYTSAPIEQGSVSVPGTIRVFNTSGGATLLAESQADTNMSISNITTMYAQSNYTLIAGTTYVFDIQGSNFGGGGSLQIRGDIASFYMFAEGIALLGTQPVQFFQASSQVITNANTTNSSFTTFSNSPAFTITPTVTGTYKIYCSAVLQLSSSGEGNARIFNTSGGATLLQESQAAQTVSETNQFIQSVYTLVAGTTYIFDIQGLSIGGNSFALNGADAPFYMFAEGISLSGNGTAARTVKIAASGGEAPGTGNPIKFPNVLYDTAGGYNLGTGQYTVQAGDNGYWRIGGTFQSLPGSTGDGNVQINVNGSFVEYILTMNDATAGTLCSGWTETFLNVGDVVTWVIGSAVTFASTCYLIATRIGS